MTRWGLVAIVFGAGGALACTSYKYECGESVVVGVSVDRNAESGVLVADGICGNAQCGAAGAVAGSCGSWTYYTQDSAGVCRLRFTINEVVQKVELAACTYDSYSVGKNGFAKISPP
jgi:hypothetical protein